MRKSNFLQIRLSFETVGNPTSTVHGQIPWEGLD